jgi:hypothetical protein
MKDSRIIIFRKALDKLVDSLEARVRIERWAESESIPDPLRESAAQLITRLGAANRLAAGRFSGGVADTARVTAIADAVRRLDTAYVAYCRGRDRDLAAQELTAALVGVKSAV